VNKLHLKTRQFSYPTERQTSRSLTDSFHGIWGLEDDIFRSKRKKSIRKWKNKATWTVVYSLECIWAYSNFASFSFFVRCLHMRHLKHLGT